jgi:thiosulfate/3-mercaptopyruvate sulfurtransferase
MKNASVAKRIAVIIMAAFITICFAGIGGQTYAATKSFSGKYVVKASTLKSEIDKGKDIKLVDTRESKVIKKTGTIKGSENFVWQQISRSPITDGTKPGQAGFARSLSAKQMNKRLGKLGLNVNDNIVLFSSGYKTTGWGDDGRVAWQLIQCGYRHVRIVNGGFPQMKKAGFETAKSNVTFDKVSAGVKKVNTASHDITTKRLKKHYKKYTIIDVRDAKEYKGAKLYGETTGGHMKGAKHINFHSMFNSSGTLKSNAALKKMFAKKGIHKNDYIVTYCTGGIRSAYMQLVLQQLGYRHTYNYAESVYRWSNIKSAGTAKYWVLIKK